MDMSDLKNKLLENLPEGACLDEAILEQVAGGVPMGLGGQELMSRMTALGVVKGKLMDAKPGSGGGGLPKPR